MEPLLFAKLKARNVHGILEKMDDELYTIISQGDRLNELHIRLKSLPNPQKVLESIYQSDNNRMSLLMLAALHGHDTVVRTILSHSIDLSTVVELSGRLNDFDGNSVSSATALWCACDQGHYMVARTLIEVGKAKIGHGPNESILFDAIMRQRLDTIQFLVENNYIDINRTQQEKNPKFNSLMASVHLGRTNIVTYLLGKGAEVDLTIEVDHETALGYAALHGHLDIVTVLCAAGASTNVKNSDQETPLRLAYRNDHLHVVSHLLDLTDEKLSIEELELMICSLRPSLKQLMDDQSLFSVIIRLLEKILHMREKQNCLKVINEPILAYKYQQECQTVNEFNRIQDDYHRVYIEILLMRERILMSKKMKSLCDPLINYGEYLVRQGDFESCLHLWEHAFHLYQNMGHETSLHRFLWIFCRMIIRHVPISSVLFLKICRLTLEPSQQTENNASIKNVIYLVVIAAKVLAQPMLTRQERQSIMQWISDISRCQRTTTEGQTLLHLCVNQQTYLDITFREIEIRQVIKFPNLAAVQLLLAGGRYNIDLNAVDKSNGNTALHIISQSNRDDALPIAKLLINIGAHIDCLNKHNRTPLGCVTAPEIESFLQSQQILLRLKCLCARHIVNHGINYTLRWPKGTSLNDFIYLHGDIAKKNQEN
ncbi:hypothetical protein I4U23_030433 [Adineta vaga]|nr:hypothetical protein I4U23_030433 [Adineta vaga]